MQLEFVVIDGFNLGHILYRPHPLRLERSAATGSTRMAIFYYNPSPYGIASLKGAQAEAAKLGVQLDAFDANNNPQLQATQIQDAITTGKYKAFWVWGLDDPALTPVINKAISKGIKVACADYTWGTLAQQNVLTATPTCLTTVGQSIGAESTNLETTMNSACTKMVGSGHCNIAFLPGLANYPTDTVRINAMTAYYKGEAELHVHCDAARHVRPDGLAGRRPDVLHRAQEHQRVRDVRRPDGAGAMTAMKLVGGYTPGKNIADHRVRRREGDRQRGQGRDGLRHPRPVPGLRVAARHPVPGRRGERASRCRTWSTSSTRTPARRSSTRRS